MEVVVLVFTTVLDMESNLTDLKSKQMEKKQEILQLFNEVGVKTHSDAWDKVIEEEDWDMIADEIVKLFSMSDVVGQGEQFYCKKGTCNEEEQCNHCWNIENPPNVV